MGGGAADALLVAAVGVGSSCRLVEMFVGRVVVLCLVIGVS